MYLYFQRSNGDLVLVSEKADKDNVHKLIDEDLKKRNPKFKVYYIRSVKLTAGTQYDVGSWTEFYWLLPNKPIKNNINNI